MKWLIRILFILIAVVGLTFGALLLMPGDKLGAILADQVRKQTGRELNLSGDVHISFWPVLGMETGPVTFGNALWASPQPMLSAESLAVGVDAEALLSGGIRIKRVIAANPVLRLEVSNGQGNWGFQSDEPDTATGSGAQTSGAEKSDDRAITLEQLELTGARLIYTENGAPVMDFP
ncbi:MAG: AsmA family protein, partial [Ruegeria sp.]